MLTWKSITVGGLAVALAAASAQAGSAPVPLTTNATPQSNSVVPVEWRGRGGGSGGGFGLGTLLGLGAGVVVGSIIADQTYRPRRGHDYDEAAYDGPYYYPADYRGDPREICAQHFRTFEWRSGFYTTYGGEKRLCPYLR